MAPDGYLLCRINPQSEEEAIEKVREDDADETLYDWIRYVAEEETDVEEWSGEQ